MVGDVGIEEELDLLGIQHCGGPSDADKVIELKPGYALPHDKDVRRSMNHATRTAVVSGRERVLAVPNLPAPSPWRSHPCATLLQLESAHAAGRAERAGPA